jgi:hypothetical protein
MNKIIEVEVKEVGCRVKTELIWLKTGTGGGQLWA